MEHFFADCTRCGTKGVSFTNKGEFLWDKLISKSRVTGHDIFAICGICKRGVVATFMEGGFMEMAPSPPEAPGYLPDNIKSFFNQAMNNLPKNWDAAGAMFRKTLDVTLTIKFPDIKGTLNSRICAAAKQHKLTPELAQWAHQIRLDGNNAAHEEEPLSQEEAQRLADFTNLVVQYLFTLPGMLERAQAPNPKVT